MGDNYEYSCTRTLNLCFEDEGVKLLYSIPTATHTPIQQKMGDSGVDLHFPKDILCEPHKTTKVSLEVKCSVYNSTQQGLFENGYKREPPEDLNLISQPLYIYPRSSIGKTPLRLANSVGIIDAQYRGNIIVQLDNISDMSYNIKKGQRLFQICSQDLTPFENIKIVDYLLNTERGAKGIGSTGK